MAESRVKAVEQIALSTIRCLARILAVSSEAAPFAKADGFGALPKALVEVANRNFDSDGR